MLTLYVSVRDNIGKVDLPWVDSGCRDERGGHGLVEDLGPSKVVGLPDFVARLLVEHYSLVEESAYLYGFGGVHESVNVVVI